MDHWGRKNRVMTYVSVKGSSLRHSFNWERASHIWGIKINFRRLKKWTTIFRSFVCIAQHYNLFGKIKILSQIYLYHTSLLCCCCSVARSCSTLLDPTGLQNTRLPCLSPSHRVCPSSCPLHWWYHPAISSSVAHLFCLQPFPAPGFFQWFSSLHQFSSVHFSRSVQLFATPWTAARQASLSITSSWSPPKPMSIGSVMPTNHLILCCLLLLLPSIFPSIRVFSNESALHIRWPKYWSFSFNISPSSEHPGLISFRLDWLDLLEEISNTTVQRHQFFHAQLSL